MASDQTCEPDAAAIDQARCILRAAISDWLQGPMRDLSLATLGRQVPYELVRLIEKHPRALEILARAAGD